MAVEPSDVRVWRAAFESEALLALARRVDASVVSEVVKVRRAAMGVAAGAGLDESAVSGLVAAALSMVKAREKGARKFGLAAEGLFADVAGVEQATSVSGAGPKAGRFAASVGVGLGAGGEAGGAVLDVGCGVGGDAMALVHAGCEVVAVDVDPVRAAMAVENAGCGAACAEASSLDVAGRWVHVDPARRAKRANESHARRTFGLEAMEPGVEVVRGFCERALGVGVKLSPGVDGEALGEAFGEGGLWFTSEPAGAGLGGARKLTQATWFSGRLRGATSRGAWGVRADGTWWEVDGEPVDARDLEVSKLGRFLVVADPAVERAELLHRLGMGTLWPGLGLLTGDGLSEPGDAVAGLCRGYEVLAEMPWRLSKVKRWLADHAELGGVTAVKTRGKACDPDTALRALRAVGGGAKENAAPPDAALVVFVLRLGTPVVAVVARPVGVMQPGDAA